MYNQILEALQFLSTPEKRDFCRIFLKQEKVNMQKVTNSLV